MPFTYAADGTEIYYTDWGKGRPVVLIHGWPLSGDMWEKQSTFLAENGLRVVNYDRRGFGRSGKPWDGYDYGTFTNDLDSVLDVTEVQDAVLVGFSMGGGEVARYLGRGDAGRISKAVLVSAVTPFLLQTADNPDGIEASVFHEIEEKIRADRPAFMKSFAEKFYGRTMMNHTVSQEVLDWNQNLALQASLRATLAAAKAWSTRDFRPDLQNISVPVRVIHGTSDATVPIDKSARLVPQYLRSSTSSEYEGEPHGLFLTAADRLNDELLKFCSR